MSTEARNLIEAIEAMAASIITEQHPKVVANRIARWERAHLRFMSTL